MQSLLAGLTMLILGDSHFASQGYLITTLQDALIRDGARVSSFAACGAPASIWVYSCVASCGTAQRIQSGPIQKRAGSQARTTPVTELVQSQHPNIIVVAMADTMGGYVLRQMPRDTIMEEVTALTDQIRQLNIPCIWVGPSWGSEGGPFLKTFARVRELSDYLATIVAPCTYIPSTELERPGAWPTFDGQHFTLPGYQSYGTALAARIAADPQVRALTHR